MTRDRRLVDFDGVRVAYETCGEGARALVLVHGWAADRRHWRHQLDGLATDRRMIAVDLPGHGDSDKPERSYPFDWLAQSVGAVLDVEGITRAVAIGHSNGVPVVRQLQRLHAHQIEALVAVDGPFRLAIPPQMREWMKAALARPDAAEFMRNQAARAPVGALPPDDQEIVKAGARAAPIHVHLGGLAGQEDPASWSLDPIPVPLLVIVARTAGPGAASDAEQAFVRSLAPRAEIEAWDSSHFVMQEHPERFNRRIEAFLEKIRVAP